MYLEPVCFYDTSVSEYMCGFWMLFTPWQPHMEMEGWLAEREAMSENSSLFPYSY
jgi:hypothetical protein